MKVDRFTKVILCIIAALLFLRFAQSLLASNPAFFSMGSRKENAFTR